MSVSFVRNLIQNSGPLVREISKQIVVQVGAEAIERVVSAGISLAADTAQQAISAAANGLSDFSSRQIASWTAVHCPGMNDDSVVVNEPITEMILAELETRDDGAEAMAEEYSQRNSDFTFSPQQQLAILSANRVTGCAIGTLRAENDLLQSDNFTEDRAGPANRNIRNCVSFRSSDGRRVSREPHEYRYCRDSGQIGSVLQAVGTWQRTLVESNGQGTPLPDGFPESSVEDFQIAEDLNDANISFDQADYSFGNFVDLKSLRSAIEDLRRIRRSVRIDGASDLLRLAGTDVDSLIVTLLSKRSFRELGRDLLLLDNKANSGSEDGQTLPRV